MRYQNLFRASRQVRRRHWLDQTKSQRRAAIKQLGSARQFRKARRQLRDSHLNHV